MKFRLFWVVALILLMAATAFAQDPEPELGVTEEPEIAGEDDLPKWTASGSVGFTMTSGNSETRTATGGLEAARLGDWINNFFKAGISYGTVLYPEADDFTVNTNNIFGTYRFEGYYLPDKKPYFWVQGGAEFDPFQGFWQRYTIDGGPGYSFFGKSKYVLKIEAGYLWSLTRWIERVNIDPDYDRSDTMLVDEDDNPVTHPDDARGELHYWEPTHNGIVRLIASVPIQEWVLFTEEAVFAMNFMNEDDYKFISSTGMLFKITSRLGFSTNLKVSYFNSPGTVEDLDATGTAKSDANGDTLYERADNTDITWTNSLVISIF